VSESPESGVRHDDLERIEAALEAARHALASFTAGREDVSWKGHDNPVTEADLAVDRVIRTMLPRDGEGWLSEETADDRARLHCHRVWVVDPIDGTKEFVRAIPEWCVSVGLVIDGQPVAGGILNPTTAELVLGSVDRGVTLNGAPAGATPRTDLDGAVVLASRSEIGRGEWDRFRGQAFEIRPTGSVAYKLAMVAAGKADATWTLTPKHEWDVAAGAALVLSAGGTVWQPSGGSYRFNAERPKMSGFVAAGRGLVRPISRVLDTSKD
jgi:myo-inositol-1(or 4)-monophosphatase